MNQEQLEREWPQLQKRHYNKAVGRITRTVVFVYMHNVENVCENLHNVEKVNENMYSAKKGTSHKNKVETV